MSEKLEDDNLNKESSDVEDPALPSDYDLTKVGEHWGKEGARWQVGRGIHWLEHPRVQERINQKVSGDVHVDRFQYFIQGYLVGKLPVERALTLGCGFGALERGLSKYHFCREHQAIDLSEEAIVQASESAQVEGLSHIHYRVGDLNSLELPAKSYDVILGVSSVHHVSALEHLYEQVWGALKPGGYFFLDEFIGPTQYQWSDSQLEAVNEQLEGMSPQLRAGITSGHPKAQVVRPTVEEMNAADPSEAIRSSELLSLLSRYFQVIEVKGYGGTLLHLLLEDIAGNFGEDQAKQLERLFDLEDEMIDSGVLEDDFAAIIAQKDVGISGLLRRGRRYLNDLKKE